MNGPVPTLKNFLRKARALQVNPAVCGKLSPSRPDDLIPGSFCNAKRCASPPCTSSSDRASNGIPLLFPCPKDVLRKLAPPVRTRSPPPPPLDTNSPPPLLELPQSRSLCAGACANARAAVALGTVSDMEVSFLTPFSRQVPFL